MEWLTPVINIPVCRYLYHIGRPVLLHGDHPRLGVFAVVCMHYRIAHVGSIVGLAIVVHERMVILDLEVFENLHARGRDIPIRCSPALRILPCEVFVYLDRLSYDFPLLVFRQKRKVLVGIAMQSTDVLLVG